MNNKELAPSVLKVLSNISSRLEKRLFLLRVTLSEEKGMENLKDKIISIRSSTGDSNRNEQIPCTSEEFKIALDCCDLEVAIGRVTNELTQSSTFKTLFEVVHEYEKGTESFEKEEKMLSNKREEVQELKRSLDAERDQSQPALTDEHHEDESLKEQTESTLNMSYLKQIMTQKVDSKKEYYDYLFREANEKAEEFEREMRIQNHADFQTFSVWLKNFQARAEELDTELRETFDNWALKKREMAILKKYRKLNLEKIKSVTKQIYNREQVIEADRKEKEIERQKAEEEHKRQMAAIRIQAFWRGTMVRKHLGPYKKKKKKKGKKGKKGTKK